MTIQDLIHKASTADISPLITIGKWYLIAYGIFFVIVAGIVLTIFFITIRQILRFNKEMRR